MTRRSRATALLDFWSNRLFLDWAMAIVATGLYIWLDSDIGLVSLSLSHRRDLYLALAAISGSLLGFSIAAISILVGLAGPRMRFIRKTRWSGSINSVFSGSIRALALATVLFVVAYILDGIDAELWQNVAVFAAAFTLARLSRLAWLLNRLVELSGTNDAK